MGRLPHRRLLHLQPGFHGWIHWLYAAPALNHISWTNSVAAIYTGLGEHILYVGADRLVLMMKYLYLNMASYYMCAGLVKLSLLCQYLRMFKSGVLRTTCLVLLYTTGFWTLFWFMQGWFPCFPVSGFWDRQQLPPPKCTYLQRLTTLFHCANAVSRLGHRVQR